MKHSFYIIALIFVLTGCAKVTQDVPPCANPPQVTNVLDTIVASGTQLHINAYPSASNATLNWTGPDNLTYTGTQLDVYVYDSLQYGMYTVTPSNFACVGKADTFYIRPNHPGSPPCTIATADLNKFVISDGRTVDMPYPSSGSTSGYFCSNDYEIRGSSTNADFIYINTLSQPVAGGYYDLDSTCNITDKEGHMSITDNARNARYTSISGRMYCNMIAGQKYITFCGAVFRKEITGTRVTLSGNLAID